jgi:hypothetical protein
MVQPSIARRRDASADVPGLSVFVTAPQGAASMVATRPAVSAASVPADSGVR